MRIKGNAHWTARKAAIVPPSRRDDVTAETLDGEAILLDPSDGQVHRLNETSLMVWRSCDGHRTTRQIAQQMTEAYDVDFEGALDWVDQLVARFAALGLFERPSGSDVDDDSIP